MKRYVPLATAVGLCLVTSPALGQNCPEVENSRARLVEFRTTKSQRLAQLQEAEASGPKTIDDQDRLNQLQTARPGEIAAQLARFRQDQTTKRTRLLSERNQRIAEIANQRNAAIARNDAELAAQQSKYNDLVAKGPQIGDLDAQAQRAADREAELVAEKRQVIADLRSGKFCSECGRSAFEIEKGGGQTFEQHLVSVSGYAVMRPEQIQARSDSYDQQIAQARQSYQDIQGKLTKTRSDHRIAVDTALAAVTRLKVDGPAAVINFEQQHQAAVANSDIALAGVESELNAGIDRFTKMEADRAAEERNLKAEIADRSTTHEAKLGDLREALRLVEAEEAPLKAAFLQAAGQCRAVVIEAQQQSASQDYSWRQAYQTARQKFADTSYEETFQHESARRSNLDAGAAPPSYRPSSAMAQAESAVLKAGGMLQSARRSWKSGLGLRETDYYRNLDVGVRQKIDANIDTFTSGRNTAREVLRDSIGRLRSGSTMALLRNAFGQGNGVAPDLATAVDNAAPSLTGTIRRRLMPTVEAMAIEVAVDSRERQAGRSFDPQERVAERGYVRAMAYILDRKKAGEEMLNTYSEAMDTFMVEIKKSLGDGN